MVLITREDNRPVEGVPKRPTHRDSWRRYGVQIHQSGWRFQKGGGGCICSHQDDEGRNNPAKAKFRKTQNKTETRDHQTADNILVIPLPMSICRSSGRNVPVYGEKEVAGSSSPVKRVAVGNG
jgi:hypothetical protein